MLRSTWKSHPQLSDWINVKSDERSSRRSSVSQLGPVETAVDPPLVPGVLSYETCFEHSGWESERQKRVLAMKEAYGFGPGLLAFATCRSRRWILKSKQDPNEFKSVRDTCKSPWCKPCARTRAAVIRTRLAERLDDRPVRFVTLTLRNQPVSLKFTLDRLYKAFRLLRQRKFWKSKVLGGVAFLEVKIGKFSGLWHPHLHCLIQGRYLDKKVIRQEWLACTGDSNGVDLRLVRDQKEVAAYVTKYATKAADLNWQPELSSSPDYPVTEHERLVEAMRALRSRRRVIPFGEWRGYKLLAAEPIGDWELYCHENELRYRASLGEPDAVAVLAAFETPSDDPSGIFFLRSPPADSS
jgi:hypothetical protein